MGTKKQELLFGGDKRDRTADLLHAMQALSQLSYTPTMYLRIRYDLKLETSTDQKSYLLKSYLL